MQVNSSIENTNGFCVSRSTASLEEMGRVILTLQANNVSIAESLLTQFLNSSLRNSPDDQMTSISEALGRVFNSSSDTVLKNTIRRYATLRTRNLKENVTYGQLMLLHSTLMYNILPGDSLIEFGNQVNFDPFQIDSNNNQLSSLAWVGIAFGSVSCLIVFLFWYRYRFFRLHGKVREIPISLEVSPSSDDAFQKIDNDVTSNCDSVIVEVLSKTSMDDTHEEPIRRHQGMISRGSPTP
jgi:hypothetical protein